MGEKDFQQLFLVNKFIAKKYKNKIYSCRNCTRQKNFFRHYPQENFPIIKKNET